MYKIDVIEFPKNLYYITFDDNNIIFVFFVPKNQTLEIFNYMIDKYPLHKIVDKYDGDEYRIILPLKAVEI